MIKKLWKIYNNNNSLYYILQSLNKLYIIYNTNGTLNVSELQYILCYDCKIKVLVLRNYRNITVLQNFLKINDTLTTLNLQILNKNDILLLLSDRVINNNTIIILNLSYSKRICYLDLTQIITKSNSLPCDLCIVII